MTRFPLPSHRRPTKISMARWSLATALVGLLVALASVESMSIDSHRGKAMEYLEQARAREGANGEGKRPHILLATSMSSLIDVGLCDVRLWLRDEPGKREVWVGEQGGRCGRVGESCRGDWVLLWIGCVGDFCIVRSSRGGSVLLPVLDRFVAVQTCANV
jgi:hypothetical protein